MQVTNEKEFARKLLAMSEASRRLKKDGKDVKELLNTQGIEALLKVAKKAPGAMNKFKPEVEEAILKYSLEHPIQGQRRVAAELNKAYGWKISEGGVRRVWIRNHLELMELRIQRLKAHAATGANLSEAQKAALDPKPKIVVQPLKDLTAEYPGEKVAQEVFSMGVVKGIGKVHQQIAMDIFSGFVITKAYTTRTAINSAEFVNSKILPTFEEFEVPIKAIVTNKNITFCGNESHPYELFCIISGISHKPEKLTPPQLLRAKRIFMSEFYKSVQNRNYTTLEELNADLADFTEFYNNRRKAKEDYPMTIMREGIRSFIKPDLEHVSTKWTPKEHSYH